MDKKNKEILILLNSTFMILIVKNTAKSELPSSNKISTDISKCILNKSAAYLETEKDKADKKGLKKELVDFEGQNKIYLTYLCKPAIKDTETAI